MRPYVLEQLAALCQSHPIQLKVIFVPSPQIGYNLTTALAASGQSWLNLQTTTPSAWAADQLEARLSSEGRRMVTQDAALLHLEDMLDRAGESAASDYFAGLPRSHGLTRSFLRTLQSLRSAGVSAEELEGAGAAPTRSRPLALLYRGYRAWQEREGRYDEAELFARAIALLPEPKSDADGTVYAVLDETPLAGLAFRYVEALSGGGLYRIGRRDYGCDPPPHSAAVRFSGAPFPPTAASHVGPGARLLGAGLSPSDREHLRLRRALGAENEVRAVFREVLHQEIPLDAVEIAYTRESPYLALLYDAAERLQIPVTFAEGVPVTLTRPGQALSSFYRWIGSGLDPAEMVGMCRAGLLAFNRVLSGGDTAEVHHLGREADATGGEASLIGVLLRAARAQRTAPGHVAGGERRERGAALEGRGTASGGPPSQAESANELAARRLVNALLGLVPPGSRIAVRDLTEASVRFLRDFAPVRSERDATARDSLVLRLQEIGADVELTAPLPRLVQALSQLNTEHKIGASVAEPGHVHVVPLARAGYAKREHLYIAGLDEGSFPGGAIEDPILLDDERARLSAQLSLQRARPGEQVWQLMRVLGMAPGRVTLLASCRNLVDGRETHVSPLFHQAAEQLTGGHPDNVPLVGSVPPADRALDEVESMLAARREADFTGAVRAAFPWLVAGEAATTAREDPGITRFDGWLRLDAPDLDVTDGTRVVSASQLEALTACPYRYFLRYVLDAEAPDEIEEDPAHWLTPPQFGALLHDLFCRFMKALQERGESPNQEGHAALLQRLLDREIDRTLERIPVLYGAALRADRLRLEQAARIFLAVESTRRDVEPVGFEVSFGFGESGGLNCPEPVILDLSGAARLALRGRIDRVDRLAAGYEIWDYKTGSATPYDEQDLLQRGAHLQWALYARALEQMLAEQGQPGRVLRSGYFFIGERENGRRIGGAPPEPTDLNELLAPLFDLVARGWFPRLHRGEPGPCTFCDYQGLCAEEPSLKGDVEETSEAMDDHPEILADVRSWLRG